MENFHKISAFYIIYLCTSSIATPSLRLVLMLYRQKQAILVFEAVNVARYIFFPCFHLLLFWDVDGDLEKIGAGDVFVPLEALV